LCGAHSPAHYARWRQRLLAQWDHPRIETPSPTEAAVRNARALGVIWPVLTAV